MFMSPWSRDESAERYCVLLIDDDRKFCHLLQDYLQPLGYAVETAHTGTDGVEQACKSPWHAVILDVMLPGMDGFEVLKAIRRESNVPVLMLTARGEEADRIVGLEIGADDYLPKTFSPRELLARLRAVTRRPLRASVEKAVDEIALGALRINIGARIATLGDVSLALTAVEFDLLVSLARAPGRVKSREALLDEVRTRDYEAFDRSIDVHIVALRKKLGDDAKSPRFIKTIRSVGYVFVHPDL